MAHTQPKLEQYHDFQDPENELSARLYIYIYLSYIYIHIQQDHKTSLETAPYILCSFQDPENYSSTAGEVLKYFSGS